MPTFIAPDGTQLAHRSIGTGAPLVCLPGGPMLDVTYLGDLGDLGGLHAGRQLIMLELRGTGSFALLVGRAPADATGCATLVP